MRTPLSARNLRLASAVGAGRTMLRVYAVVLPTVTVAVVVAPAASSTWWPGLSASASAGAKRTAPSPAAVAASVAVATSQGTSNRYRSTPGTKSGAPTPLTVSPASAWPGTTRSTATRYTAPPATATLTATPLATTTWCPAVSESASAGVIVTDAPSGAVAETVTVSASAPTSTR